MECIGDVDPEELEDECAKYVFKEKKLIHEVAGASANIFRECKTEIKVVYTKCHHSCISTVVI